MSLLHLVSCAGKLLLKRTHPLSSFSPSLTHPLLPSHSQVRRRYCTHPSPKYGGQHCFGNDTHVRNCVGGFCKRLGKSLACSLCFASEAASARQVKVRERRVLRVRGGRRQEEERQRNRSADYRRRPDPSLTRRSCLVLPSSLPPLPLPSLPLLEKLLSLGLCSLFLTYSCLIPDAYLALHRLPHLRLCALL